MRLLRTTLFTLALTAFAGQASAQVDGYPSFRPMGFGDVSYVVAEGGRTEGFFLGQAVGHMTGELSNRVTFFGEVSATAHSSQFSIEVERLILRYDFANYLKLSAGRFHTPIGYWNTAFHHGLWLQTSVARPRMIKFGSRLLPVHFVGLQIEGSVLTSTAGLGYKLGVGNGRGLNVVRAGDDGDANDHRAMTAVLTLRPPEVTGLELGTSFYADRIVREIAEPEVRERILDFHIVWERRGPELIAEYARIWHGLDLPGEEFTASDAYYVQGAYRMNGSANAFKPYARYEKDDTSRDDAFLSALELDYEAWIAGIRFDFSPLAAIKAEYRSERLNGGQRLGSLVAQASFALAAISSNSM